MLKNIDTEQNKIEKFEEEVNNTFNKYSNMEISEDYKQLWQTFLSMVEFIQNMENNNQNEMSPQEAINLMRELGFDKEELQELVKESIANANK